MKKVVSVIISARDEFPNLIHTIHSILNDLGSFLRWDEVEIIVVDNGSVDRRSWEFIASRGLYAHGTVRILHDPIFGNVSARNKGVELATGDYIFFSDAHMSYPPGTFATLINAIDQYGGIVHPAVQWMGGWFPSLPSYQYSLKIGEKLWGTWNRLVVGGGDKPFYIPVSGHCCLGVRRKQFLEFGGYNPHFRCYGGGELYLDLKWWMKGSNVMCVPDAVAYHLSAGRGYSYNMDDLIHNMILLGYALGAPALGERVYFRYLSKPGAREDKVNRLNEEAIAEAKKDHLGELKYSLYDLLTLRPWDAANDKLHGTHNSGMLVYDNTWLAQLNPEVRTLFEKSAEQRDFSRLIEEKLKQFVYKGKAE